MSIIQLNQKSTGSSAFTNGFSVMPVLENACERIQTTRCTVAAGSVWKPERFAYQKGVQIFVFLNATGFVHTDKQAFQITGPAAFVPNYDKEPFEIHAGAADLECIRIVGDMNDEDCRQDSKNHMIFPRFRLLADGWEHTTRQLLAENANTRAFVTIENRKLGCCYNMEYYTSAKPGAAFIDEMHWLTYDQWFIALPDADFTFSAEGESAAVKGGDIVFIPKMTDFSICCGEKGKINFACFLLNRAYDNK